MEPTIPVGALLLWHEVVMDAVEVGYVICFRAKESAIFGKMIRHRVKQLQYAADGSLQFITKGDANLSTDGYYVTAANLVGKVIWYTGANHVLSKFFSFFTNKIGFLACIVFPCLLVSGLILRDCVRNIRNELQQAVDELEQEPESDLLTQEEYRQVYEKVYAELLEELRQSAEEQTKSEPESAQQHSDALSGS